VRNRVAKAKDKSGDKAKSKAEAVDKDEAAIGIILSPPPPR